MHGAIVETITASQPLDVGCVQLRIEALKIPPFDPAVA
jgi:hypothetical protein